MRDRGKGIEQFNGDSYFMDTSLQLPCKKHPSSSSSGGICAVCLRDKLARLVCPQCGEQRLPNCSCSLYSEPKAAEPEILRRSNSISSYATDVNQRGGLWRFRKLFRKKKEKTGFPENPIDNNNSKNEPWGYSDVTAVQRSRSLSSFRGGGASVGGGGGSFFYDNDQDSGYIHSAARASSVSMMESAKMSCFSESEARMSNFDYDKDLMNRGIYTMREGYEFSSVEDPKFIDLKPSSSSEIRNDQSYYRKGYNEFYGGYNGGESCRYSVSENELKKCRKSRKGWKWPFKGSAKEKG